ncbi:MAG: DMT family transporter [Candidatus Eisenbacteria bacterium]
MRTGDLIRLLVLGAIWGSSYIFIRLLAPAIGVMMTVESRVAIAGAALILYCRLSGVPVGWRRNGKHYLAIGVINSAAPFLLYAFAALHLPASYSVILNSSAPLFGAVFAAAWLGETLTVRKILALLLGAAGVALVARAGPVAFTPLTALAFGACMLAAACYGLAGVYVKKMAAGAPPPAIAGASHVAAAAVLLAPTLVFRHEAVVTPALAGNVLTLALLCSAIAYLLYFRLIADIGPTKSLTVTFLMPAFGMVWGAIFLHEAITPAMIAGCALILLGTAAATGVRPGRSPRARRSRTHPDARRKPPGD